MSRVKKSLRAWRAGAVLLAVTAAHAPVHGQTQPPAAVPPLTNPVPLAPAPAKVSPGTLSSSLAAAERAHDLGFLTVAESLYRQLLDAPGVDKRQVTLSLVTVLLDKGEAAEAERLLADFAELPTAAWRLRAGMAALQLRKRDAAQAQWDAIRAEEISDADRPWYHFFTGTLYDTATPRDETRANTFYVLAERGAPTELARARFQLAAERLRVRQLGTPTPESVEQLRQAFERSQGREASYETARQYVVNLALLNRRSEAVQFLQQHVLLGMPAQERAWRDEFNFLIGVLGDRSRNGIGRNALLQLVATGVKTERQRQALQLLAEASTNEPERGHFRDELTRLIRATPPHPLRETLLYFRAHQALAEKDYAVAEDSARRLLADFPASPLKLHAYGVLTQSAWEQQRYRLAASNAREALATIPTPPAGQADPLTRARMELGVLAAEAWFRLNEFRNAADAYDAVLRERPAGLKPEQLSGLIFQRVLAEIRSGSPNAAAILDEAAANPAFNINDRWQAEWSLARELQVRGKTDEAYARVGRLLSLRQTEDARLAALQPNLRARMAWLHAKLAFASNRLEETLAHVEELLKAPGEIEPALQQEIASTAVLLRAEAELQLKREPAALATLKRLRDEFPNTDAAVHSYLIEADYYAQQEKIPEAQQRLTSLIDNPAYAKNENRPYALFQLALLSERLGQEKDLEEANKRIEQLVNLESAAGEVDLIFAARLKQGDLLRRMSQFPQAQRAYEYLVNNYAQRPDVVLAQLALADCHNAQSSTDPTQQHQQSAQLLYAQLRDRVDAPADVKVEAGYKHGMLLERRGQQARAAEVWWKDVVDPFLLKNPQPFGAADKRPYWLARTLLDLGRLYEEQAKFEDARNAYTLVVKAKLGNGENIAREALKRLGVPEARL